MDAQDFTDIGEIGRAAGVRSHRERTVSSALGCHMRSFPEDALARHHADRSFVPAFVFRSAKRGRSHESNVCVDKRRHDHFAGCVDFTGTSGTGEVLQPARRAYMLHHTIADQYRALWNDIQFGHSERPARPARSLQRQQLPGVSDQRPFFL